MNGSPEEPPTSSMNPIGLAIFVLALATALIHFSLAIPMMIGAFLMNGAGYIVLAIAYLLPGLEQHRRRIRWLFIGFTALTIVLWLVFGQPYTVVGFVDKAIELALIAMLLLDARRAAGES